MTTKTLVFLGKHPICDRAKDLLKQKFQDALFLSCDCKAEAKNSFDRLRESDFGLIVCFLYPYILPAALLDKARLAVNFHPGSRHYPGTGCYNFALYDNAPEYGAVCHLMKPRADTGSIFLEKVFPIARTETIQSLQDKTHSALFEILQEFCDLYLQNRLNPPEIDWTKPPTHRKQLDEMAIIKDFPITREELQRRIRAFHHPRFPLKINIGQETYVLTHDSKSASNAEKS